MDIANQKALHERPPYTQNIDFWAKQRNIAMKNYSAPTNLKDKQLWQIHTSSLTFAACLLLWMTTVDRIKILERIQYWKSDYQWN